MLSTAIVSSLLIGWFLGFVSFFGFRIAYKEWIKVLNEEKEMESEAY